MVRNIAVILLFLIASSVQALQVKVINFKDRPVSGALVNVVNSTGDTVLNGTSDANGVVSATIGVPDQDNPMTATGTKNNIYAVSQTVIRKFTFASNDDIIWLILEDNDFNYANKMFRSSSGGGILGIPREQVIPVNKDTILAIIPYDDGNTFKSRFFKWPNYGAGAIDSTFIANITYGDYDHSHFEARNDTVWQFTKYLDVDSRGLIMRFYVGGTNPRLIDTSYFEAGLVNQISSGGHYGDGSDMVLIYRTGGGGGAADVSFALSSDNGVTWVDSNFVYNYGNETRIEYDAIPGTDSGFAAIYQQAGATHRNFRAHYFDGISATWHSDLVYDDASDKTVRAYSAARDALGNYFFIWTDTATPSHVVVARKLHDGSSYRIDTLHTFIQTIGASPPANFSMPTVNVNRYNNIVRFYWTEPLDATLNNYGLYKSKYNHTADFYGPVTRIDTIGYVAMVAGCLDVPTSTTANFSSIIFSKSNNNNQWIHTVMDTTTLIPVKHLGVRR